jgi:hypothetical protein
MPNANFVHCGPRAAERKKCDRLLLRACGEFRGSPSREDPAVFTRKELHPILQEPELAHAPAGFSMLPRTLLPLKKLFWLIFGASLFFSGAAFAQSPVRRSFAKPVAFDRPSMAIGDYNIKLGPVAFKFSASLRSEFTDNANYASGGTGTSGASGGDLILSPSIGMSVAWQVTKLNTLHLSTSFGYSKYLNNPQFDSQNLNISPDSQLTFDVYTGDFRFRFFDAFSIQDDPMTEGALNNVGRFTRLNNTIGLSVLADLNQLLLGLGYQHSISNVLGAVSGTGQGSGTASDSTLNSLNHYSDTVQFTLLKPIISTTNAGFDVAADVTRYPDNPANDSFAARIAPFIETQVTRYTKLRASGGYQTHTYLTGGTATQVVLAPGVIVTTPTTVSQGTQGSIIFNVSVIHQLNRYYSDNLSIGQQTQTDALNQLSTTRYANYSSSWQITPLVGISTGLSFQDVTQTQTTTSGSLPANYQYFSGSLSTGYKVTKHLSASLAYQYTKKIANVADQGYTQNRISLLLTYDF